MRYKSTRGGVSGLSFEEAVMMGLASDGGLLIPEKIPNLNEKDLKHLSELSYTKLAYEIMSRYQEGIPSNDLMAIIQKSYAKYDTVNMIPVRKAAGMRIAELYHGPTYSFKDVALQFLGNLFEYILTKNGQRLNILGATSGDTGSAAIYGVKGKNNINIFMLYPANRVSQVQEMQMTTTESSNVFCLEIGGNFDNCQDLVKRTFNDIEFKEEYNLGAVNSINWARILAQTVYYFWIYFKTVHRVGDEINVVVPTGNFGNIFAGYLARRMGLPIAKLMIATNRNNILTRAVKFGDYSIERVHPTISPAMDIQVASNFERYLYYLYGEDCEKVSDAMELLRVEKEIDIRGHLLGQLQRDFIAGEASDNDMKDTIRKVFEHSDYVIDPHTACGVYAAQQMDIVADNTVCLSTAHPAKFPDVIHEVLGVWPEMPEGLHDLEERRKVSYKITPELQDLKSFIIQHAK